MSSALARADEGAVTVTFGSTATPPKPCLSDKVFADYWAADKTTHFSASPVPASADILSLATGTNITARSTHSISLQSSNGDKQHYHLTQEVFHKVLNDTRIEPAVRHALAASYFVNARAMDRVPDSNGKTNVKLFDYAVDATTRTVGFSFGIGKGAPKEITLIMDEDALSATLKHPELDGYDKMGVNMALHYLRITPRTQPEPTTP